MIEEEKKEEDGGNPQRVQAHATAEDASDGEREDNDQIVAVSESDEDNAAGDEQLEEEQHENQ